MDLHFINRAVKNGMSLATLEKLGGEKMDFLKIFLLVYAVTTAVAIVMTYREQKRKELRSPLFTLIGYVLCSVWPIVVAVILLFERRHSTNS